MESAKTLYKTMEEVMTDSMIPYSEYVIMDRALPRVEDGLKPVQRRVLYAMMELGIMPDKPYKKCARIVGDCLGKYHPHGDTSVYGALARMAQPFNMGSVLVDGHGNYGSIDGDKPAAMRYTEARLAPLALELMRDLEKNTVNWQPNFDDSLTEPCYLPGRFPNLLVNGATGIAVGLATNIPPHNLVESIDGVIAYIDNPNISLEEMMKTIKGPDFPSGGIIVQGDLVAAYETGKGKIGIRARVHVENEGEKRLIVIDELPYQVNKSALLESVLKLREDKKGELSFISDISDESDRNGMRAVIKVKKDGDVDKILELLFKNTDLHVSYGINMVAIADGKPQQMGLLDIIAYYVNYQRGLIIRRTKYELEQAKERAHILEGLVVAVKNIDEVVRIIKTSKNTTEAKERLRERFSLSERQVQAIIELRLGRLTALEVYKLEQELDELRQLIERLTKILGSRKLQMETVKNELFEIRRKYKQPRKSLIISDLSKYKVEKADDQKVHEEYVVAITEAGTIKKMLVKNYNMATKDYGENSSLYEVCSHLVLLKAEKKLCLFTNLGNCYKLTADDIPMGKWREKGDTLSSCIKGFGEKERVIYVLNGDLPEGDVFFFTKCGMVKKSPWSEYSIIKHAYQAMKLREDDEVIGMQTVTTGQSLVFVTANGMCLRCDGDEVPGQGRISAGVKGVKLSVGDEVIAAGQNDGEGHIALITENGYAKRMKISDIDIIGRYSKGVKCIDFKQGAKRLVFASIITEEIKPLLELDGEYLMCVPSDNFKVEARIHSGKPLVKKSEVTRVMVYKDKYQQ
ncbi:MAG: DNA topoisomerase 4 subunit A [Clostridiales bacterium]|nr:DNA topoisomerase 4 subunit A [Clostridiales bacterium]